MASFPSTPDGLQDGVRLSLDEFVISPASAVHRFSTRLSLVTVHRLRLLAHLDNRLGYPFQADGEVYAVGMRTIKFGMLLAKFGIASTAAGCTIWAEWRSYANKTVFLCVGLDAL
jgi:hypothetical protein